MSDLGWCFFSFPGRLKRLAFVLATVVLVITQHVLGDKLDALFLAKHPPDHVWQEAELRRTLVMGDLLAGMLLLWPNLATMVKRARDIGIAHRHMALIFLAQIVIVLVAPGLAVLFILVCMLILAFAPSDSALRLHPADDQ